MGSAAGHQLPGSRLYAQIGRAHDGAIGQFLAEIRVFWCGDRLGPPDKGALVPEEDSKSQYKYLIAKDNAGFGFEYGPNSGPKYDLQ